jgi:hypothetical protein
VGAFLGVDIAAMIKKTAMLPPGPPLCLCPVRPRAV